MAGPHSTETPSSSSSAVSQNAYGITSSSSSTSQVREEENGLGHPQLQSPESDLEHQHMAIDYGRVNWASDNGTSIARDDTWSCIVVLFFFWLFVSITMILGVYRSISLPLSPNSSILLQPNPMFVQSIKVENLHESGPGIMLYGTYGSPSLDIVTTWEETCNAYLPFSSRKEWKYYLNRGSQVKLNIRVRASLYNTTEAYYKCALTSNPCGLNVFFPDGNAAILTSASSRLNISSDAWHVKLSYGPRWISYIFGIGGMTLLVFLAFNILGKFQQALGDRIGVQHGETATQRTPLLSNDDLSSWVSSYDSMPHEEEDLDFLARGSIDRKSLGDGETSKNMWRLCAICFDAPRDCFFLPCGHCVACFACGTRIAEAPGNCPVCRRNMNKVKRIVTV